MIAGTNLELPSVSPEDKFQAISQSTIEFLNILTDGLDIDFRCRFNDQCWIIIWHKKPETQFEAAELTSDEEFLIRIVEIDRDDDIRTGVEETLKSIAKVTSARPEGIGLEDDGESLKLNEGQFSAAVERARHNEIQSQTS
jgi:hypothetical protein